MSKTAPQQPKDDNDEDDGQPVQRVVPAGAVNWPGSTAPISAFDAGRKAKAAAALPPPNADKIVIRKGVPIPGAVRVRGGVYLPVIKQMQPGDSVELPLQQAKSFYARAKEHGKTVAPPQHFVMRKLSDTKGAVWRDA